MAKNQASVSEAIERDLRLDFFRGLGLWMIFLDHIPDDVVSWLTLRNYGFSDAAEFFVFISGYLAGADAAIQAGRSRRAAALHSSDNRGAADAVDLGAPSEPDFARLSNPVRSCTYF